MEHVRVPNVHLVDATGKSIGVYRDDPDWWQQLNKRENEDEEDDNDADADKKKSSLHKTIEYILLNNNHIKNEDNLKQCNVIGETPLHIAIMYEDFKGIKYLIEQKGFSVNQRSCSATNEYKSGFNNRAMRNLISNSFYGTIAYFGEYPLSFAACFCNKEIYDYLIEHDADPNLQDSNGNTLLHVLVINNKLDMFQYALKHPLKKASLKIKNNQDLTPLNLAAKLGRLNLFLEMLEARRVEFWRYHNISCSAYPFDGLDTISDNGKIEYNSALNFIINGNSDDHLAMIESGVVKRLLEDKWRTYAQRRFFQRLSITIVHLIFLSIAIYCRDADHGQMSQWPPKSAVTWCRYVSEMAVVLGSLSTVCLQTYEIYVQGFLYFIKNLKSEPANVFFQLSCILIIFTIPFRFVNYNASYYTPIYFEETLLILAAPCSWIYLLFFARIASITGPFVVMIYKMIAGDILTFSYIYVIFLISYGFSFYYLFKNGSTEIKSFNSLVDSLIHSFQMTFGEFKDRLNEFDKLEYSDFTKVVFASLMIILHILLLNMLVAMMGNTYQHITRRSKREWKRQWAHIVILLERTFSSNQLKLYKQEYSINTSNEQLALLVIKTASKTKALQKRNAINNWKRLERLILNILKNKQEFNTLNRPESPFNDDSNNNKTIVKAINVKRNKKHSHKVHDNFKNDKKIEISNNNDRTSKTNRAFMPNKTNRIYPMISQSLSSIDKQNQSNHQEKHNQDNEQNYELINEENISRILQYKYKNDDLSYITKNESYPKFPLLNIFKKRNNSTHSSASELMKE